MAGVGPVHASRVTRRRLSRAGAAVVVVIAGILAFAAPAFAHAQLLGTSPAAGAVVASPPAQVVLTFGETVQAPPGAIEVFSADGQQLQTGPVEHPSGRGSQVGVTTPPAMKGTYVVSWRVISADTHPVQGAFTFSVGAPSAGTGAGSLEQHLLVSRHPSRALGVLTGTLRTVILLAVIVAVGGAALVFGWPGGIRLRAVRNSLAAAVVLTAVVSVAAVVAQGPYDAGRHLGDAFRSNVLSPVLHSSFGTGAAVRVASSAVMLAGVVAGVIAASRAGRGRPGRGRPRRGAPTGPSGSAAGPSVPGAAAARATSGPASVASLAAGVSRARAGRAAWPPLWLLATLAGAAGLVVSLSLSGHATTGRWEPLGFIADLVHVASASVWVGGLLVLAAVLYRPGPDVEAGELERVVRRFSSTALVAVALIVASGVFQAWRQVGSWGQLTETDYGTVLLLKVTLVAAAVEAGWFSRRWVHRRFPPADAWAGDSADLAATAAADGATPVTATPATATPVGVAGVGAVGTTGSPLRPPDRPPSEAAHAAIPGRPAGLAPPERRGPTAARFRRWLAFEAAIGIVVVALTGVLIDTAPPEGEKVAAASRAYTGHRAIGTEYLLSAAVYPLVPGTLHVAVQLTNRATDPVDAFQVSAQLTLPARKIGPLSVPLTRQATGSWVANNVVVPLPGRWELLVAVLTDPITEVDTAFHFTVYG